MRYFSTDLEVKIIWRLDKRVYKEICIDYFK